MMNLPDTLPQPATTNMLTIVRKTPNIVRRAYQRKYQTPEEFVQQADAYFDLCEMHNEQYAITGLSLYLGFSSPKEMGAYIEYEEFTAAIEWARGIVVHGYEKRLAQPKPVGAIFALKNMGWRDERHVDVKSSDGSMTPALNVTINTAMLPMDVLAMLYEALTVTPNENLLR